MCRFVVLTSLVSPAQAVAPPSETGHDLAVWPRKRVIRPCDSSPKFGEMPQYRCHNIDAHTFRQVDGDLDHKYEGTGLGLPLTKALVEQHGGALDLQSEDSVGTTVTVRGS